MVRCKGKLAGSWCLDLLIACVCTQLKLIFWFYFISRFLYFPCNCGRFGNVVSFSIRLRKQLLSDFPETRITSPGFLLNWFCELQGEVGVIGPKRKALLVWMLVLCMAPSQKRLHLHTHTHRYTPQLWSCYHRSRDAVGKLQHWTALMGTGAATSGSPLAVRDLSTQIPCREADRQTDTLIPAALKWSIRAVTEDYASFPADPYHTLHCK